MKNSLVANSRSKKKFCFSHLSRNVSWLVSFRESPLKYSSNSTSLHGPWEHRLVTRLAINAIYRVLAVCQLYIIMTIKQDVACRFDVILSTISVWRRERAQMILAKNNDRPMFASIKRQNRKRDSIAAWLNAKLVSNVRNRLSATPTHATDAEFDHQESNRKDASTLECHCYATFSTETFSVWPHWFRIRQINVHWFQVHSPDEPKLRHSRFMLNEECSIRRRRYSY